MNDTPPNREDSRISIPRWAIAAAGGLAVLLVAAVAVGVTLLIAGDDDGEADPAPAEETVSEAIGPTGPTGAEGEETIDPRSCEAKDIVPKEGNEGACLQGKQPVVVVNKDSTLELDQLDAQLKSIEVVEEISGNFQNPQPAKGVFVVGTLQITNTTSTPHIFDSFGDATSLLLCGDVYNEDFNVENGTATSSFVWRSKEIGPGQTVVGRVVYDIPDDRARCVEDNGNLRIVNFKDEDGFGRPSQLGIIRTYM